MLRIRSPRSVLALLAALFGLHSAAVTAQTGQITNPILFVTQVPTLADFAARGSTFANHGSRPQQVIRGGDLMIRYPNGTLRNLTQEAGYGMNGFQGANAIAVREPSMHWNGTKAVFSMIVGAPPVQYNTNTYYWQMYEVSGLGQGQTVSIVKVPNQPANYNNVSPFYGTDDQILFTSDRPRDGQAHLYPQLDEYESTATVTGIWKLNPATGTLNILNHTPSGAFSPSIDSFGRVVFIRWDHLQQDQQADADRGSPGNPPYGSFNYTGEAPSATPTTSRDEVFPETRAASNSAAYGPVNGHTFNFFTPWQMNENGTEEETLNHVGRHELSFGYNPRTFANDSALSDYTNDSLHANQQTLRFDGGMFHLREDPVNPGHFFGIHAREFGSLSTSNIIKMVGGPNVNPEAMTVHNLTPHLTGASPGGRFRNPLPLTTGALVATHTAATSATPSLMTDFRLKQLAFNAGTGFYEAGTPLTPGINKSVTWWDPDASRSYNGALWEIEAVEVVARAKPNREMPGLELPESQVFTEEGVNETALRDWLKANDLALIVTRNQTSRDRADLQQPFNLRVPGGVQTVKPGGGRIYDIKHYQIFQGDQIRGYNNIGGRRVIPQTLHGVSGNPANPGGPAGSVKIFPDGSTAAFVPARRALAWQTTDANGEAVVRERVWVTFQPGEVRVCASCHGANQRDQVNATTPVNKPEALRTLLQAWKATNAPPPTAPTSNIVWQNSTTSEIFAQLVSNYAITSSALLTPSGITLGANWKVAAVADLDGNNSYDVVLRNTATGEVYGMLMNGLTVMGEGLFYNEPNPDWKIVGSGDFNGDNRADLLWRNTVTGDVFMMLMNGLTVTSGGVIYSEPNTNWQVQKVADFNGDDRADILWRNTATGDVFVLLMNGTTVTGGGVIYSEPNASWQIQAAADYNGDGRADVLWRNSATGDLFMMLMNGTTITGGSVFYSEPNTDWKIVASGDYNGNASADILWRNTATGQVYLMQMNGTTAAGGAMVWTEPNQDWKILGP
jgi:hypothetical protein